MSLNTYAIYDYAYAVGCVMWPVLVLGGAWAAVSTIRAAKTRKAEKAKASQGNERNDPLEYVDLRNLQSYNRLQMLTKYNNKVSVSRGKIININIQVYIVLYVDSLAVLNLDVITLEY